MGDDTIAGRYRLVERLGVGAMSEVWRAEDAELGRTVAVKLLRPEADRARFEREARAVAALSHPNINQLFDYGEADGRPFIVLEYLPGGSLHERLVPGERLADAETERVATDIAAGLAHAHSHQLVHRDLKPANVLFDADGRAKLADFGIARLGGAGTLTEAGTVLGTAAFISPEQASGLPATPASDVYSFGVILFRLLTGRAPFEGDDPIALVARHVNEPAPAVGELRPDAPADLAALAAACLAKDPADRPRDGSALLPALASAAPTAALATASTRAADTRATRVLPATPSPAAPSRPPRMRTPLVVGVAALALLGAAGAVVAVLATRSSSPESPPTSPLELPSVRARTRTGPPTTANPTTSPESTTQRTTTRETPPPSTTQAQTTQPPPETTASTSTETTPTLPLTGTTVTLPGG